MTLKCGAALVAVALLSALTGCSSPSLKEDEVVGTWVSTDAHEFVLNFAENRDFWADDTPRFLLRSSTPLDEVDWEDRADLTGSWEMRNRGSITVRAWQFGSDSLHLERDNGELRLCSHHDVEAPWDGYCFVKDAGTP